MPVPGFFSGARLRAPAGAILEALSRTNCRVTIPYRGTERLPRVRPGPHVQDCVGLRAHHRTSRPTRHPGPRDDGEQPHYAIMDRQRRPDAPYVAQSGRLPQQVSAARLDATPATEKRPDQARLFYGCIRATESTGCYATTSRAPYARRIQDGGEQPDATRTVDSNEKLKVGCREKQACHIQI